MGKISESEDIFGELEHARLPVISPQNLFFFAGEQLLQRNQTWRTDG
jgi:hypothetical protein